MVWKCGCLKALSDLTKDQISILRTVDANPGIKPTALIDKTKVKPATLYRILHDFRAKGLVATTDGGCYSITDTGNKKLAMPLSDHIDSEDDFELDLEAD